MIVFTADIFAGIYYYFFPLRDLQPLSTDRHEILHDDGKCIQLNNLSPKFQKRGPPKKNLGTKNMQKLARI